MNSACIAIAAACVVPCALACSSGDGGAPASGCDGGDASHAGDTRNADVTGDAQAADALIDRATADVLNDATVPDTRGAQASTEGGAADASIDADASREAEASIAAVGIDATLSTTALLRFANWSPDAPAVDFCLAPHGTTAFRGPIVEELAASRDAGPAALALGNFAGGEPTTSVSAYFDLPPGQYDARVVAGGAVSCAVGIVPDATIPTSLAARTFSTIALVGEELPSGGDPGLQVVSFTDDGVSTGLVQLRFINAAPAVSPADLRTNDAALPVIFQGVPFGFASSTINDPMVPEASLPAVDANGYQRVSRLADATIRTLRSGTSVDSVVATGLSAAWGSVLTIAMVGGTSAGVPARLIECVDNAGTVGPFSNCALLQ